MPSDAEIDEFLASSEVEVRVHGMTRLAYIAAGNRNYVFTNGFCRAVSMSELETFRQICFERAASVGNSELFLWLLAHGAFDLATDERNGAT
jgi:hypothetical protein